MEHPQADLSSESLSPFILILRWIAVVPAACGAFVGIQLLLILMNAMTREGWSDWMLQLINSGASSYCFVAVGAITAPRHKFVVAVVLAILFGIFIVVVSTAGYFVQTSEPYWWLILAGVISLLGSIFAVVKMYEARNAI
jgi:hypothetical protein